MHHDGPGTATGTGTGSARATGSGAEPGPEHWHASGHWAAGQRRRPLDVLSAHWTATLPGGRLFRPPGALSRLPVLDGPYPPDEVPLAVPQALTLEPGGATRTPSTRRRRLCRAGPQAGRLGLGAGTARGTRSHSTLALLMVLPAPVAPVSASGPQAGQHETLALPVAASRVST